MKAKKDPKKLYSAEEDREEGALAASSLFSEDEIDDVTWRKEWRGMPEFVQEEQEPFERITVCFNCEEDRVAFSRLVGQTVTENTKVIWYPPLSERRGMDAGVGYVDES